ncbi:MAG: hypothetical protein A3J72_02440 [Nitrospirae bacterium RIFCSPHIGHO2_02_FULL_40_19]|nr:MAG: hypothetical protein A3J72_02440 [Nitrospirae bacterium RIFCSPHIGHO2_02_FULL_40_19]
MQYLQKIDKQIPWIYDLVGIAFLTKSALKRVLMTGEILNMVDIQFSIYHVKTSDMRLIKHN